ncbi:Pol polyprotein [Plakobranchus ocellatus]|uniref:Pol polyprotein n=1 Tax=Plakobranchus ocellatus TaxID=259542 RepID=A0AAV4CD55_9GAST|nr:Pol polyprotein [Plakobranchus ocellatus]
MPFGLSGAPATFQRLLQSSMNDLVLRIILVYLDDVLVFSGDFDDHIKRLETVFNRLRELGLKLNPEKCQFGAGEVHYLWHIISKEGVATDPDKVSAVNDWPTPKTTQVDASFEGIGAILTQEQPQGRKVIAYASRSLRPNERNMNNYSSFKLELLGMKWALTEKFRGYLLGAECTVVTDNNPLSHLQTAKLGAIEQRWTAE